MLTKTSLPEFSVMIIVSTTTVGAMLVIALFEGEREVRPYKLDQMMIKALLAPIFLIGLLR